MVDSPKTCVDPYLDSFTQSFAAANYKAGTINNYLHLVRKLGRLMDATGIEPSALSPDLADQLARTAARGPASKIRLHNLARRPVVSVSCSIATVIRRHIAAPA